MLDRQDIDALLVGALYGELSSADEAALTAHLDSHPGDRTALDDLKSVRAKLKTSRIFEIQLEPPQAVSALLLQEAARRAPKIEVREKSASWFERFITAFVKHPAMAAAATLVLVVGVAGTVFLKNNAKGVEQTASQPMNNERLEAPQGAVAWGSAAIGVGAGSSAADPTLKTGKNVQNDDSVAVNLDEGGKADQLEQKGQREVAATRARDVAGNDKSNLNKLGGNSDEKYKQEAPAHHRAGGDLAFADGEEAPAEKAKPSTPSKESYVAIGKDQREPKDLSPDPSSTTSPGAGMAGGAATGSTQSLDGPAQQPVPAMKKPSPVVAASPPPPPASAPATVAKTEAKPDPEPAKPDANLAWAKSTHARVAAFVKDGNCKDAAPLALAIRNRAPDYYNSTLVTDRALKPCMQYIADTSEQREKAAASKASRATDTR